MATTKPTFVILPRSSRGGLTKDALAHAKQVAPGGFEFKTVKTVKTGGTEDTILQDLKSSLPSNVVMPTATPFAVLKHVGPSPGGPERSCICQCGGNVSSCGGGGGGGGSLRMK